MQTRRMALLFCCGVGILDSGCIVQSFYPHYTGDSIVTVPGITGEWSLTCPDGDKTREPSTWNIMQHKEGEYTLSNTETNRELPGDLLLTFFRCGGDLLCDITTEYSMVGRVKVNGLWLTHLRSMHSVCLVSNTTDEVVFTPLKYEWLFEELRRDRIKEVEGIGVVKELPYLVRGQDGDAISYLVVASPAEWMKALKKMTRNRMAFDTSNAYRLQRRRP